MNRKSKFPLLLVRAPRRHQARKGEFGMALILVLLLLMVVSAIALGMLYMSNTESAINTNYRDTQLSFFAMRAGLEEARDRMRTNSPWPVTPPTTMPGSANSVAYIINPASSGDSVDPQTATNQYFDDEFCHEYFSGIPFSPPPSGVPCTTAPQSGSVATYISSISPNTGAGSSVTNSPALKFKWARITLKQNGTFAGSTGTLNPAMYVDSSQSAGTQICYQSLSGQQIPVSLVPGGPFVSCAAAQSAGADANPVYVVTSMAITPQGSRRIGQYEVASLTASVPPLALGMDGPAAVYSPVASSSNTFMNGTDDQNGYPNPPGCTSTGTTVPAVTVGDNSGVNNITTALQGPPNRSSNYNGCTNTASPCTQGSPSVVNGASSTFAGAWSSPSSLDNMVQSLADIADSTYTCGVVAWGGSACSPSGSLGSDASPQITYVNGDFNYGNASGAGVLIVTGTLSFSGNATFDGLILVVGQGAMAESGGGSGGFNGSVFLARTQYPNQCPTAPCGELPALSASYPPTISWNGGGTGFIQYNSCWAKVGNGTRYSPIATREEMY